MAGTTGLEPATSDVTGRRSNQLSYVPELIQTSGDFNLAHRNADLLNNRFGGCSEYKRYFLPVPQNG